MEDRENSKSKLKKKISKRNDDDLDEEEEDFSEGEEVQNGSSARTYDDNIFSDESFDDIAPKREGFNQIAPEGYNIVASITFNDGYTLRQQFEFFKHTVTCAPMMFTKKGLAMSRGNVERTFVCETFIDSDELLEYYVDENRWNTPEDECHIINLDLKEFYESIKSVTKKESICICQYAEIPNAVFITTYGGNKTNDGCDYIMTEPFTNETYNMDNEDAEDLPIAKVTLTAFSSACQKASKKNCQFSVFKTSKNFVTMVSGNETGTNSKIARWGTKTKDNGKKTKLNILNTYTTRVSTKILRGLVKIANFNTNGIVRIYSKMDGLIRLETRLGSFGVTRIYLLDKDLLGMGDSAEA